MELSEITSLQENAWNVALHALDRVLGFESTNGSTVKKLKQYFDQNTSEHVIVLEYRVRYDREKDFAKANDKARNRLFFVKK
jgi:hypothetical protein